MGKWKIGTPQCGIAFGVIGALIALMLLFLGFWSTVFVALFFAAGYFIGSSRDKAESVRKTINKIFPPKSE